MTHTLGKKRNYTLMVFLLGLLVAGAAFLPYVVFHKGYFFYYGDFNVQQLSLIHI